MSINSTVQRNAGVLSQHKVLRQTYALLGLTTLFSALCAYVGVMLNVNIPPILAFIAVFGLSFAISAKRNSGLGILLLFALTGFLGFYVSNVINLLFSTGNGAVVYKALAGTAIIFFGLSAYSLISGTNFNFLGGFLFVGVLGAFLLSLGGLIFNISGLNLVVSGLFLFISAGYVLYDTSKILHGEETNYIIATLNLFINIFNLFVSLLNILSAFNRN